MTLRRLWKEQMGWSWMVEEFVWIILSPREHTHLHQAFTWADQLKEGRLLLTTVATGHDQDPVPIAQDAIDTGAIVPQDFASSFWFLDFQASNVSF